MEMEECIEHFSHEHPLNFFQLDAHEDPKPHRCRICGLPILSTPSYTCSNRDTNCNFFVHKPCTQLPESFRHQLHLEDLYLVKLNLPQEGTSRVEESYGNFTYICWHYPDCEFDLHPLVAKPVEIKSQHISHESHPLVAFCKEIASRCDACGEEEYGFFFLCQECNFWIHQDCTILPSVVKLSSHPHPFVLAYSLPDMPRHISLTLAGSYACWGRCSICNGEWNLPNGAVYFSGEHQYLAHVACAKLKMENVIQDIEILHLPDEEDTFPSLVIRRFVEKNPSSQENKIMTKYHKHPLFLEDACSGTSSREYDVFCDVCKQSINMSVSQFYRCHDCHFLAHRICADHLPARFECFFWANTLEAQLHGTDQMESFFNSVFLCGICFHPSNGFSYKVIWDSGYSKFFDLECTMAPKIIKHASHKQHHLLFTNAKLSLGMNCKLSCCSRESIKRSFYKCIICNYSIHISCALLPETTRHKFDEHPLELIMSTSHDDDKQGLFCEVCEQDIEHKLWYYGCHKCEQYFHIDCIPSVGYHSKVKFGKTHFDYKIHCHPLTLTRMLTHERHERCAICNKIIKGFSDDQMAFNCSTCDFWIHFSCAAANTKLQDYSLDSV